MASFDNITLDEKSSKTYKGQASQLANDQKKLRLSGTFTLLPLFEDLPPFVEPFPDDLASVLSSGDKTDAKRARPTGPQNSSTASSNCNLGKGTRLLK
ncbi:hypothetical protein NW762_008371 [Fusarium torreyae]|uniref:Uncharacterized protein n=1 Tax=Fusarium torreyae TaxID=1237075 RepID=A0A9W8RW71_9HYPO|nr:hypothetical protein NW762_008371 [Fusarium torreyae]